MCWSQGDAFGDHTGTPKAANLILASDWGPVHASASGGGCFSSSWFLPICQDTPVLGDPRVCTPLPFSGQLLCPQRGPLSGARGGWDVTGRVRCEGRWGRSGQAGYRSAREARRCGGAGHKGVLCLSGIGPASVSPVTQAPCSSVSTSSGKSGRIPTREPHGCRRPVCARGGADGDPAHSADGMSP